MNDFFDKLSAAARRTADTVSAEFNVAAEEQKIRESYQALGKLYFQATREGREASGPDFADHCRRIEASLRRIRELKDRKTVDPDVYAEDDDFEVVD